MQRWCRGLNMISHLSHDVVHVTPDGGIPIFYKCWHRIRFHDRRAGKDTESPTFVILQTAGPILCGTVRRKLFDESHLKRTCRSVTQDSIANLIPSSTTSGNSSRQRWNVLKLAASWLKSLGSSSSRTLVAVLWGRLTLWGKSSAAFSWNKKRNGGSCLCSILMYSIMHSESWRWSYLRRVTAKELILVELPNCPEALWKCRNYIIVRIFRLYVQERTNLFD